MASAGTVYVAGDGSGNYNCDGVDDQIEINEALQYAAANPGTIVHLKGPFTYTISSPVKIGNDTILEGDKSTVLKLRDNAGWDAWVPLIGQIKSIQKNITVQGFTVNVNYVNNGNVKLGKGYYNVIQLGGCDGVNVNNMYMYDGAGDGLRATVCSNVKFYNNRIYNLGHDGCFAVRSTNVEAWNNNISCRTNSGLRIWNTDHVSFHDNIIDTGHESGPGIQLEKSITREMGDIRIYNNTIHDINGPAIWIIGYGQSYVTRNNDSVQIYHNLFYGNGRHSNINWGGGVVVDGFHNVSVFENIFDSNRNAAVLAMRVETGFIPQVYDCKVTVRDNIITNTISAGFSDKSGYGVENRFGSHCTFAVDNNCVYNNKMGAYKNVSSTTDMYTDPMFTNAAAHDYRLQSNSPMKKLIGVPIGFQGYIGYDGSDYSPSSHAIMGFVDVNVPEATTQDIYNFRDYLTATRAGKYKNITTETLGGRISMLQYNSPVLALLAAYASADNSNVTVAEYIPSIVRGGMITGDSTTGGNGSIVYNMNNIDNSTITNYNDCNVTNNITNINIDSHDKHIDSHDTYYYDSHDTYYNNTTINYYNNTTIIYYYGSPDPAAVNTSNSSRREVL